MSVPLINGQAYEYAQIVLQILGVPIAGVSSIEYKEEQEKKNNFGIGNRPVSRGRAAIESSGSLEISMNDVEAIRDANIAGGGSMLTIPPFTVLVTFGNPQKVVTHQLMNCEFIDDGVETSQGDTDVKRKFGLVISHVKYR